MYIHMKRLLDIVLTLMAGIVLLPVFVILILCIKIDSKGPILFKQKRIGKDKTYFYILKFRTMSIDTPHDVPTHLLTTPEQYITRVGKFLRKTSLDELPQLWNVFVGDMSLIGPRPALWNQDDLIKERDLYGANAVKPGLTGWAQISGRDELEIPLKAKLDGDYVANLSFKFDCRCFFGTFKCILKQEGILEGGTGQIEDGSGG